MCVFFGGPEGVLSGGKSLKSRFLTNERNSLAGLLRQIEAYVDHRI